MVLGCGVWGLGLGFLRDLGFGRFLKDLVLASGVSVFGMGYG